MDLHHTNGVDHTAQHCETVAFEPPVEAKGNGHATNGAHAPIERNPSSSAEHDTADTNVPTQSVLQRIYKLEDAVCSIDAAANGLRVIPLLSEDHGIHEPIPRHVGAAVSTAADTILLNCAALKAAVNQASRELRAIPKEPELNKNSTSEEQSDDLRLVVQDDTMAPAYNPGDVIHVSSDIEPYDGCNVVAAAGEEGDLLLRHYRARTNDAYDLWPENPEYPTLTGCDGFDIDIKGVVIKHDRALVPPDRPNQSDKIIGFIKGQQALTNHAIQNVGATATVLEKVSRGKRLKPDEEAFYSSLAAMAQHNLETLQKRVDFVFEELADKLTEA